MTQWILTSSVLILLVIAVRGLFKEKMKAKYTYALWLIVLVRLLCPVNFGELSFNLLSLAEEGKVQVEERLEAWDIMQPVYFDAQGIRHVAQGIPTEMVEHLSGNSAEIAEDSVAKHITSAEVPSSGAESTMEEPEQTGFQLPAVNWKNLLPVVWAVGMVVLAIVIVSVNVSFSTMLGLFRKELPFFSKKGHGGQKLPVYMADGIYSSCLYGVVRPSIYLNRKGMGEQEERYCIEHEYSHYLQGDMLWSVCRIVCLILHWYNPLVWLAVRLSKKDAEIACDERTIERLGEEERYSYGHTLVELAAKQSRAVQMFCMATLMASDKKEVVNRVKAITTKKQTKIITGLLVVCLLVGIGCFVFTGVAKGEQENNNNDTLVTTIPTPMPTYIAQKSTLVTEEQGSDWAGVLRIYKEKDVNSTYIEQTINYDCLRAVTDIGDEHWFMVETIDGGFGWVLYGEHEGLDAKIRSLLGISEEEYAENRANKKLETSKAFENEVTYRTLTFTDHVALDYKPGEGWLVDLNGDGTEEQLYITGNRVYLNEKMALSYKPEKNISFWLLDIDTTDGMYELLDENGSMFIYNGSYFCQVTGVDEKYFVTDKTGEEYTFMRYFCTLPEFTRIDKHTISFEDNFFMETSFFANACYTLDENHGLQLIPQEYEVTLHKPVNNVRWYNYAKNKDKLFRVYKDRDLAGEYVEAEELTGAKMTKSDCVEWAYIEIENGLSGWLYFGEESEMHFTRSEEACEKPYPKISLCLYTKKNTSSSCKEIEFGLEMLKTVSNDAGGSDWCYLELFNGDEGWVFIENKDSCFISWYLNAIGWQEGVHYSAETGRFDK